MSLRPMDPVDVLELAKREGKRVISGHRFKRDDSGGEYDYRCIDCGGYLKAGRGIAYAEFFRGDQDFCGYPNWPRPT